MNGAPTRALADSNAVWRIRTVDECDSTNSRLLQELGQSEPRSGDVLLARRQSQGRGRQGRTWQHAPNALAFSLLWRMARHDCLGLPLAVGLAMLRGLTSLGAANLRLKWPNDLWWQERKMAGILVESASRERELWVVIGIGLNYDHSPDLPDTACLAQAMSTPLPDHATVLSAILAALSPILETFNVHGFAPLQGMWMEHHALLGRQVRIRQDQEILRGQCGEVDSRGSLCLHTEHGSRWVLSGDIEKS